MVVKPFVAQSDTSYKQYEANQIDQAPVPIARSTVPKCCPTSSSITIPTLANGYFAFNYLVKPFDNIKVRQAFSLAIDRDSIEHNIYKDTSCPPITSCQKGCQALILT